MEQANNINKISSKIEKMVQNMGYLRLFLIIAIIILLILIINYIRIQLTKREKSNVYMKAKLDNVDNKITSINFNDAQYQHKLRDYYIMSSYSSCSNGDFNNSFVDYKALKNVIKRGARLLDFEVYSVNNQAVIGCSYTDNVYQKGSYNSLPFSKVMEIVNMYCFSASSCPNFRDPLFLHFRIKSNEPHVYETMSNTLVNIFKHHILPSKYNYQMNGENIGNEPLQNFKDKVIFICDKTNEMFTKSGLDEIINLTSGGQFLKKYRNYDLEFTSNYEEVINANKKNMGLSMPDLSTKSYNMNSSLHMKYGCQFCCMNFQNLDANMSYYLDIFNNNGSSFILKPEELRYIPVTIPLPKKQSKELSFADKEIKEDYFDHKI
jgi:hypothetical protein